MSAVPSETQPAIATADPSPTPDAAAAETVISASRNRFAVGLSEMWRYRDLFLLMAWRDFAARYRQSVVGIGWAVVKPVVSMLIFTFIFGRVAGIRSDGSPYPLFAFTALLPWMYFSTTLNGATQSVVGNGSLIKKVYFPRLFLPMTGVVTALAEIVIQLVLLAALLLWFRYLPPAQIVLVPVFVLFAALSSLSVSLWLTSLNVKYRDVGQAVPFLTQAWMWLSPIVYTSESVPEHLRPIYGLNPMVGVIEGFRWCVLGTTTPDWRMMAVSISATVALLIGGLWFFRRTEATFADVV